MATSSFSAPKKRKRREKQFQFDTFAEQGYPINPTGPFRDNVRLFLRECAEVEDYTVEGMPIWRTTLVLNKNRDLVIPLFTVEETVKYSPEPLCVHCLCTGWGHHFVSKRRYHMIIPRDDEWKKPLEGSVFHSQIHLLHGLIHCNGYGHLLCINGIGGGSKSLRGREIMDLWDRICTNLQTRKITVEDVSRKHSMDLRLLYGVGYGHAWFGRWRYRFCRGSFGVNEYNYETAKDFLASISLDQIISDFGLMLDNKEIIRIIRCYRDLSEAKLDTIRDLIRFMLTLKLIPSGRREITMEQDDRNVEFSTAFTKMDCRWSKKVVENAAKVIVEVLKETEWSKFGNGGITREELRNLARTRIGDTGLIDFTLKSMNNVRVGNIVVTRAVNKSTRVLEYTIHELIGDFDICNDLAILYTNVLMGYLEMESRTLLDAKYFVKEWPMKAQEDDQSLRLLCRVMPSLSNLESDLMRNFPISEVIVVLMNSTIDEVREASEHALRDTYCVMDQFKVNEVEVGVSSEVLVRGTGMDLVTELRYEGGERNWVVRCECGAVDDDGERMVACDVCEAWQHTRCNGIGCQESSIPEVFLCGRCYALLCQLNWREGSVW